MRVQIYRGDNGGSGFYRSLEPTRVVNQLGVGVEVRCDKDIDVVAYQDSITRIVEVREVQTDADLLVLQRPTTQVLNAVAIAAVRQGIRICVDIDDDFHNVHPDNAAAGSTDPRLNPLENKRWLASTLELADWVTVSTPALLKYARMLDGARRGSVVRNYLPERALAHQHETPWSASGLRIGWSGTVQTHPQDLARARGLMGQLPPDVTFNVVGDEEGVARQLGLPNSRVRLGHPWTDSVEEYWKVMAESIDVGVAPLETSKFNKAKSWLKCAEYATFGIPFVASPLPEYQRIVAESGGGLIAAGQTGWAKKMAEVVENREAYAILGRRWADANTLEAHAWDWVDAWGEAVK